MKIIIILLSALLLIACDDDKPTIIEEQPYTEVFPAFEIDPRYHGTQTVLNDNSWIFEGHGFEYPSCERSKASWCRKTQTKYTTNPLH